MITQAEFQQALHSQLFKPTENPFEQMEDISNMLDSLDI
jgi:hypothetical protein